MKLAHDGIMSGHLGVKKTYDRVVLISFGQVYMEMLRDIVTRVMFVRER